MGPFLSTANKFHVYMHAYDNSGTAGKHTGRDVYPLVLNKNSTVTRLVLEILFSSLLISFFSEEINSQYIDY